MFMFVAPKFASDLDEEIVQKLLHIIAEQRETLTVLCTIAEYLKGYIQTGLDKNDIIKYNQKIQIVSEKQTNRYSKVDELIHTNILQMKKKKTTDNTAVVYGKEVRKIESGIRTLKFFIEDAINMLSGETGLNRSEERLRYFDHRAADLEAEMNILANKLTVQ